MILPLPIFLFAVSRLLWIPSVYCWSTFRKVSSLNHSYHQTSLLKKNIPLAHRYWSSLDPFDFRIQTRHPHTTALKANTNDGDDEDDDDEPPEVDIRNFRYPFEVNKKNGNEEKGSGIDRDASIPSFGLGRGRSSPSQRKAMGTSSKVSTTVYVCSKCGSESVKWRGRCPTCKEWNSFEEVEVRRSNSSPSSVGGVAHNLLEGRSLSSQNLGQPRKLPDTSHQLDGQSWLDDISVDHSRFNHQSGSRSRPVSISDIDLDSSDSGRLKIPNDKEINEVLGGGLMRGSLILLGGDPGVGKSTLALQVAAQIASLSQPSVGVGMGSTTVGPNNVGPVWYISGEETLEQIATRAQRLVASNGDTDSMKSITNRNKMDSLPTQLFLLSETNLNVLVDEVIQIWIDEQNYLSQDALDTLDSSSSPTLPPTLSPSLIVIDSIQTMVCEAGGSSSAGGISQVRESMALLLRLAKTTQIPILTIGHVTKSGDVAGPRMVEHMVDAVLYLEHSESSVSSSLKNANFRWLRAQKNRFGSCQVAGLYDFQDGILVPLPEGTESDLSPPSEDLEGCAMGICVEGPHRAMTVEVQALVTLSSGSFGKKTVEGGLSSARLNLLLGILQKHCQLPIAGGGKASRDVYVNIVGCEGTVSKSQLSLATMALDLAVAVALTSSFLRIPVRGDVVCLAQIGLLGELRPLASLDSRLLQAQRMGFSSVIVASTQQPSSSTRSKRKKNKKSSSPTEKISRDEEFRTRKKRKFDLDIYECSTLKEALDLALISAISTRSKRGYSTKSTSLPNKSNEMPGYQTSQPGSLRDLNLEYDVILDDEDDEYDLS